MAIRLTDEYTNSEAASAAYPGGSFKNALTPSSYDGTPFEKKWPNDIFGLLQKLLGLAGVTPSGAPDTVLASDYFDAMAKIFTRFMVCNDTGASNVYVLSVASGAEQEVFYDGMVVVFKAAATNSGASTLKVDALTAKPITRQNGSDLPSGYIQAGQYTTAVYRLSNDRFEFVEVASKNELETHTNRTDNPHGVTLSQAGLGLATAAEIDARCHGVPSAIRAVNSSSVVLSTASDVTVCVLDLGTVQAGSWIDLFSYLYGSLSAATATIYLNITKAGTATLVDMVDNETILSIAKAIYVGYHGSTGNTYPRCRGVLPVYVAGTGTLIIYLRAVLESATSPTITVSPGNGVLSAIYRKQM